MRFEAALTPLLTWPVAAVVGWALVAGVVLYAPVALAAFAMAGLLVWRTGQRPVERAEQATRGRTREVRALVARSA